jgi:hypothetical protein
MFENENRDGLSQFAHFKCIAKYLSKPKPKLFLLIRACNGFRLPVKIKPK